MELFLNLAWILLAVPACWLWRSAPTVRCQRRIGSVQGLLVLAAVLVLLFPVVSATDDLRAMRTEMEESPISKRSIGQSSGERSSASKSQAQPALAVNTYSPVLFEQGWYVIAAVLITTPASPAIVRSGRAPPQLLLG